MNYAIPAKETLYKGVRFRSRLEAKWAAFFDLLGVKYQYEPFDLPCWTPDFLISVERNCVFGLGSITTEYLAEVKPVSRWTGGPGPFDKVRCEEFDTLEIGVAPFVYKGEDPACVGFYFTTSGSGGLMTVENLCGKYVPNEEIDRLWAEAHNQTRFVYR